MLLVVVSFLCFTALKAKAVGETPTFRVDQRKQRRPRRDCRLVISSLAQLSLASPAEPKRKDKAGNTTGFSSGARKGSGQLKQTTVGLWSSKKKQKKTKNNVQIRFCQRQLRLTFAYICAKPIARSLMQDIRPLKSHTNLFKRLTNFCISTKMRDKTQTAVF